MIGRLLRASLVLVLALAPLGAQTIIGRVVDGAGGPVRGVRVLVFPARDVTGAAIRAASTNAQGEFRFALPDAGVYVIRVRRIGYEPEPDQTVDLSRDREARVMISLHAVALPLAPVRVSTAAPRCVALDHPEQAPVVREWLNHALDRLETRRLLENNYAFKIRVTMPGGAGGRDVSYTYAHDLALKPYAFTQDSWSGLVGVARAVAIRGVMTMPTEMTLLTPTFRSEQCFFNALVPRDDGRWTVRFRNKERARNAPEISGSLVFAADGLAIDSVAFLFSGKNVATSTAHLVFTQVVIDGDSYPILRAHGATRPRGKSDQREAVTEERLMYWDFKRVR